MKKLFKTFIYLLCLTGLSLGVCSCSSSDDNGTDVPNDDNGTGIGNSGGNGNEVLTPDAEKKFFEETAQILNSYLVASETDEMSAAAKELGNVSSGDLGMLESLLFQETVRAGSRAYTYSYYDVVIRTTACKGIYQASYGGEWKKVGDSDNLQMTFTDSHNASWVLTVSSSGSKGKVYISDDQVWEYKGSYYNGSWYEYSYDITTKYYYLDVPESITARLTRQGAVKADISVNISQLAIPAGSDEVSAISNATGTASVKFTPADKTYDIYTTFEYAPNTGNSLNVAISKGDAKLFSMKAKTGATSEESIKGVSLMADILGRIQIHAAVEDSRIINDAMDRADDNWRDKSIVDGCAATINNAFTAYCTNNGGNAQQATVKVITTQPNSYSGYDITPVLCFSDGTTYTFGDYFNENYFSNVINGFTDFIRHIERNL